MDFWFGQPGDKGGDVVLDGNGGIFVEPEVLAVCEGGIGDSLLELLRSPLRDAY